MGNPHLNMGNPHSNMGDTHLNMGDPHSNMGNPQPNMLFPFEHVAFRLRGLGLKKPEPAEEGSRMSWAFKSLKKQNDRHILDAVLKNDVFDYRTAMTNPVPQSRKSKIEKLIAELCPEGVVWKTLGDAAQYEQPSQYLVKTKNYDDS